MFWILLALVVLLFYKPRIFAVIITLLALFAIGWSLYYEFFYVPPREAFMADNKLVIIGRQLAQQGPGIYAEDSSNYYLLHPINYYKTSKNKTCPGFNRLDKDTWCDDDKFFPSCYPDDKECPSIRRNDN